MKRREARRKNENCILRVVCLVGEVGGLVGS